VPVLNLLARRSRQRGSDLFGNCSDDDLMSWGRELSDDEEPIFGDPSAGPSNRSAPPAPAPRLAIPRPAA
jgi:hypothetical protein